MNSEAITRNDLTAILNEVLPPPLPVPSEYRKLLWSNPNPASGFSAQTISLDLTDYDAVTIDSLLTYPGMVSSRTTRIGDQGEVGGMGSTGSRYARNADVQTTGIIFTDGTKDGVSGSGYAIPFRIYGIAYEQVNPPQEESSSSTVETIIPSFTTTSGANLYTSATDGKKYGRLVELRLAFQATASVASGSNIVEGVVNNSELLPITETNGCGFYGAHACIAVFLTDGTVKLRNASSTAIGAMSGTNYVSVTFTYISAT